MKKIIPVLALTAVLGACSTQTVYVNGMDGSLKKEEMQAFFLGGIGQTQTIDAAAVCGGAANVVKVERVTSFLNGLLASLSFNIYTPYNAQVYCSK